MEGRGGSVNKELEFRSGIVEGKGGTEGGRRYLKPLLKGGRRGRGEGERGTEAFKVPQGGLKVP